MLALILSFSAAVSMAAPPPAPSPTLQDRWLATHNAERVRLGMKPLVWSEKLSRDAAVWAKTMAETNSFEHAPQGKEDQGENLWMGTKASFEPEVMVGAWVDEKQFYKPGKFPDVSTSGSWVDVGHYTQLIWYNTTEVGCALSTNAESDYLVCRYLPAGNWTGEIATGPVK